MEKAKKKKLQVYFGFPPKENEIDFWKTQSYEARLNALEKLRQYMYNYDEFTVKQRLPRVLEVARITWG
jgi:hypothetical protein